MNPIIAANVNSIYRVAGQRAPLPPRMARCATDMKPFSEKILLALSCLRASGLENPARGVFWIYRRAKVMKKSTLSRGCGTHTRHAVGRIEGERR